MDEPGNCDGCGYADPVGGLRTIHRPDGIRRLCEFCANPGHGSPAWIANRLRRDVTEALEEMLDRLGPKGEEYPDG
jgi:hypothetical protein